MSERAPFRRILSALAAIALLAGFSSPAVAAPVLPALPADKAGSEVQIFVENDVFADTDRYYTSGIKFGGGLPLDWLNSPATHVLDNLLDLKGSEVRVGAFIGQNLYTPRDIRNAAPQPGDRPWAAWLYLGGVAQRAKDDRLDSVEVDVGMIGPAALGEPVQRTLHRLIDSPRPMGWENQLANEPAFQIAYLAKRRFRYGWVDVIPHGGATLGTVTNLVRVGGIARVGLGMTGFGPDTIEPGGAMLQNMRAIADPGRASWELYGFVGIDHRWVAQSIFLDGGVFRDGPSVDRRPHVMDYTTGISFRMGALRASFQRVRRSEEFRVPGRRSERQSFGSLNVGLEF